MRKQLVNVAGLTAGDAGARLAGFLITVYLARILEPAGYGWISIGMALLGQLALLASPGVQIIEARNVAAAGLAGGAGIRERVGTVLGMRLVLSLTALVLAAAVIQILPLPPDTRLLLISFTASLLPMGMMVDWYFQGKEKGVTAGAARLHQAVIYGVMLVLLVRSATDVVYVPVALFAGNAATALALLLLFAAREGFPRCRWNLSGWREVLRENAPVGLAVAMGQLVINYPPVVVGWLIGAAEAGLWGAAMKITFLALMLDRVLNVALIPPMTRILSRGGPDAHTVVTRIYRLVTAGILPVAFLGVVFAAPAVGLVFGPAYAGSAWMLAGLMGYVVLTLANSVFVCAMIGGGRERQYSGRMVIGSLVLVAAVTILTAVWGTGGTVAGVLAGEAVTLGLMIAGVRNALAIRINPFQKDLAAGAILLAAAYLVFREPALQALAGIGGYVLLLSRSFPAADLRDLQRRLS